MKSKQNKASTSTKDKASTLYTGWKKKSLYAPWKKKCTSYEDEDWTKQASRLYARFALACKISALHRRQSPYTLYKKQKYGN